jgi:hypothetical protein
MKFTYSWLKEHLETSATPEQVAAKLTTLGLEVESFTDLGKKFAPFIVAEILEAEKHPNADKLRNAYQEGQRIPQGVKIQQDYNIKRNRIVHTKGMDNLSSQYSEEFLPELEATD